MFDQDRGDGRQLRALKSVSNRAFTSMLKAYNRLIKRFYIRQISMPRLVIGDSID